MARHIKRTVSETSDNGDDDEKGKKKKKKAGAAASSAGAGAPSNNVSVLSNVTKTKTFASKYQVELKKIQSKLLDLKVCIRKVKDFTGIHEKTQNQIVETLQECIDKLTPHEAAIENALVQGGQTDVDSLVSASLHDMEVATRELTSANARVKPVKPKVEKGTATAA